LILQKYRDEKNRQKEGPKIERFPISQDMFHHRFVVRSASEGMKKHWPGRCLVG
jgi:hypothetical protein